MRSVTTISPNRRIASEVYSGSTEVTIRELGGQRRSEEGCDVRDQWILRSLSLRFNTKTAHCGHLQQPRSSAVHLDEETVPLIRRRDRIHRLIDGRSM